MLPIFSVYAVRYPGASTGLAGVAFGIYALTQCIFQIPLGWASDRWGRRPVLIIGLALFGLGSIGCGLAQNIFQLIIARMMQGTGAVGSVALAALADLTRPSVRTQAFTITGIAIGSSFMIGILGGPLLAARIGLSGLFYVLAGLSFLAIALAATSFPRERRAEQQEPPMAFKPILLHGELRPIFIATFVLSFALNLFFFTYPLSWTELGLDKSDLWKVYLIIFLPSVLLVFPYMRRAEKRGRFRLPDFYRLAGSDSRVCALPIRRPARLLALHQWRCLLLRLQSLPTHLARISHAENTAGRPRHSHWRLHVFRVCRIVARWHVRWRTPSYLSVASGIGRRFVFGRLVFPRPAKSTGFHFLGSLLKRSIYFVPLEALVSTHCRSVSPLALFSCASWLRTF